MESLQIYELIYSARPDSTAPVNVHRGQIGARSVAVKKQLHESLESVNSALNEALIQAKCSSAGVCEILGVSLAKKDLGFETTLVLEWISKDLHSEIDHRKRTNATWTEEELLKQLGALVETLAAMQSRSICHRDIKPPNLLVTHTGQVKLADFGTSKQCLQDNSAETILGTLNYLSPELMRSYKQQMMSAQASVSYDPFKSDVYSLGVTLLHMSLLRLPKVQQESELEELVNHLSDSYFRLKRLLMWMLQSEPSKRPSFLDLQKVFTAEKDRKTRLEQRCLICDTKNLTDRGTSAIVLECSALHYFHNRSCLEDFILQKTKCFSQETRLSCPDCSEPIEMELIWAAFGGAAEYEDFQRVGRLFCMHCRNPEASELPCKHCLCVKCFSKFSKPDRDVCPICGRSFPYPCPTCDQLPDLLLECKHYACSKCAKHKKKGYRCPFEGVFSQKV